MKVQVFVGTQKGAFIYSSDGARREWTVEGPLFPGWKVTAAGRDGAGGFLAATSSDIYGPSIHRSPDLRDWDLADESPAYTKESGFRLNQVWTFEAVGERVFAGVDQAGLFASSDRGVTWQEVPGLTDQDSRPAWAPGFGGLCAHHITTDGDQRIWCGISSVGVFGTEDGGATWTSLNEGVRPMIEDEDYKEIGTCVHAIKRDPDNPDRIWRQDHSGMFRTDDGGKTWDEIQSGLPSTFGFPLVLDESTKTLFCCPLASDEQRFPAEGKLRVYRSTDEGDSWQECAKGLPDISYHAVLRQAMAVDNIGGAQGLGGVYLGNAAGSLFASNDLGETWQPLPGSLPRILCVEAFVTKT